jgi:hypothetical protein
VLLRRAGPPATWKMKASAGLLLTTVVGLVWTAAAAPIHIVLSVIDECVPTPGVAGTLQPAAIVMHCCC